MKFNENFKLNVLSLFATMALAVPVFENIVDIKKFSYRNGFEKTEEICNVYENICLFEKKYSNNKNGFISEYYQYPCNSNLFPKDYEIDNTPLFYHFSLEKDELILNYDEFLYDPKKDGLNGNEILEKNFASFESFMNSKIKKN